MNSMVKGIVNRLHLMQRVNSMVKGIVNKLHLMQRVNSMVKGIVMLYPDSESIQNVK